MTARDKLVQLCCLTDEARSAWVGGWGSQQQAAGALWDPPALRSLGPLALIGMQRVTCSGTTAMTG
jgi:hypothetical protein